MCMPYNEDSKTHAVTGSLINIGEYNLIVLGTACSVSRRSGMCSFFSKLPHSYEMSGMLHSSTKSYCSQLTGCALGMQTLQFCSLRVPC